MPSVPSRSEFLPQYGFGTETKFKKLVEQNAFLFRVHTPKSIPGAPEVPFPALRFDGRFTHSASPPDPNSSQVPTYADVVRHMDWTTRYSSAYVSASFSFMWAVWEAVRRYHLGVKHDVEIALIDATALARRTVTVVEVLQSVPPAERHEHHWKWYHFAQESQSVLVYGGIPQSAVLTSVPILRIVDDLPSYCLRRHLPTTEHPPLDRLTSSFLSHKSTFRQFCEIQSTYFLRSAPEVRFVDSTATAVRLALAFLGVWFHWMLRFPPPSENAPTTFSDAAITKVTELARIIAAWPAGSETNEMWDEIIREIARLVAQEVQTHHDIAEEIYRPRARIPEITRPAPDVKKDLTELGAIPTILDPRNYLPTPPPTPPPIAFPRSRSPTDSDIALRPPALSPREEEMRVADAEGTISETLHFSLVLSPRSPIASVDDATGRDVEEENSLEVVPSAPPTLTTPRSHTHSRSETASCLLTGFLFGAWIILVLSTQRRPTLLRLS
ncbi:hypothetical protein C8R46DRAFT_968646 [Mycena filopes]|nr:hypothetical protein C8R46DRAFT_968646 [Mycena filopes]